MKQDVVQLTIDEIPDLGEGFSLFGLQDGDALEISLMDVVIAVIARP